MELEKLIKERCSCRTYLPTAISDEQIYKIVESARLALLVKILNNENSCASKRKKRDMTLPT